MSSASSRSSDAAASQPSRRALAAERTWYDGRFQRDLAVIIADGRIEHVAALREIDPALPVEQFPRRLLLPGTINAHNHSFQSLLRGVADDCDFFTWRDRALYGYTPRMTEEVIYHGARFAF
ncbi:MAG: hypothetical protein ACHQ1E_03435, partial [Ktedonobacterales bacterium]